MTSLDDLSPFKPKDSNELLEEEVSETPVAFRPFMSIKLSKASEIAKITCFICSGTGKFVVREEAEEGEDGHEELKGDQDI